MSEAKINVATGFNGGVSVSLRADSGAELLALLDDLRTAATKDFALASAASDLIGDVEKAVGAVTSAIPGTSTVGQPLPSVPQTSPPFAGGFVPNQPVAQPGTATPPPGVAYPGDCIHGVRVYSDKPARGQVWRRWECAKPWAKGVVDRCKPVNVEN